MRELREQRREKYLIEFNSSSAYPQYKQKLKKAIFRLALEKYSKEVDHHGLPTKLQKEKFKAELYTFIKEQMSHFQEVFLDKAMRPNSTTPAHNDLLISYKIEQESRNRRL